MRPGPGVCRTRIRQRCLKSPTAVGDLGGQPPTCHPRPHPRYSRHNTTQHLYSSFVIRHSEGLMAIRIVTGGIAQETNTFQWEPTTLTDFSKGSSNIAR